MAIGDVTKNGIDRIISTKTHNDVITATGGTQFDWIGAPFNIPAICNFTVGGGHEDGVGVVKAVVG